MTAAASALALGGCGAGHRGPTSEGKPPRGSSGLSQPVARSAGCGRPSPILPDHDQSLRIAINPVPADGAHQRTAVLHIPSAYSPHTPAPLVMQFHGAGPNASAAGYERDSPLHGLSNRDGLIHVFPQGLRAPNGNLGWNAYGPVYWKVAEIPFVNELLDTVAVDYCVNLRRVYASGVSNGANMVNYVACRDADRFAAVSTVAGPMFGQDDGPCRPSRPIPIIDIHSFEDPAVPYAGHPGPPDYQFPLPSVAAWLRGWATVDACRPAPPAVTGPGRVQTRTWGDCAQGARIVAYATHTGHGWPQTLDDRPAAPVVWSFLSAFTLPS